MAEGEVGGDGWVSAICVGEDRNGLMLVLVSEDRWSNFRGKNLYDGLGLTRVGCLMETIYPLHRPCYLTANEPILQGNKADRVPTLINDIKKQIYPTGPTPHFPKTSLYIFSFPPNSKKAT